MPYAIRKQKIFWKKIKFTFYPRYGGLKYCKNPIITQKIKIIVWGCLIAQMKRLDALITMQKTLTLCNVPLLKKSRKTPKNYIFFKNDRFWWFFLIFQQRYIFRSWGFLRFNQCIKTLHLSYQTPPYNDFHFSGYNGFLPFFRPPVPGVRRKNYFFFKIISVFLLHKAYKTTQSIILYLILSKKVPPPTLNSALPNCEEKKKIN